MQMIWRIDLPDCYLITPKIWTDLTEVLQKPTDISRSNIIGLQICQILIVQDGGHFYGVTTTKPYKFYRLHQIYQEMGTFEQESGSLFQKASEF